MSRNLKNRTRFYLFLCALSISFCELSAQEAYFVDGFHGGIWGHYPEGYTEYMLSLLEEHPNWRLNLEIEPDTWDRVRRMDPKSYYRIMELLQDSSVGSRVEYVNPTYAQSYFFNISGESVIRQFSYGMKKLEAHFPGINFHTYSSEEPCFTSALPQILQSFGIVNASLKNPNTCWGGYTRAHGGELVNWIGPDGTGIVTVPRYEVEKLKPSSTWETIGNANSPEYITAALEYGVGNPVGMTLQDAGWRGGPWLKGDQYKPSTYTTWRNYFENVADPENITDWKFNQEDVLVSLVWGSQILQRIAQQVRVAENNIVQAEKIAALQLLEKGTPYPSASLDKAWQQLLLAQHHDCWIVPYNTSDGTSWAQKVVQWTNATNAASEEAIYAESSAPSSFLKVYNTLGHARTEFIEVEVPEGLDPSATHVLDARGEQVQAQVAADTSRLIFKTDVPAYGYKIFQLKEGKLPSKAGAFVKRMASGDYIMETDLYKLQLNAQSGGISSLIAKKLGNREFIDQQAELEFNSLKGNFYKEGGFRTNTEKRASVEILENGPYRVTVAVHTFLLDTPVTQLISLTAEEPRIDMDLKIDWASNVEIGESKIADYTKNDLRKAFYNDRYKLLSYFPLNLKDQKVFKNAPFDVMESGLKNTFFDSWDAIKNNVIVDWVDVTDGKEEYGMALFTDHTTTYAHGQDFPLALNVQYSGGGLWGRNHSIEGPTKISYALIPHKGTWQEAGIWQKNDQFREPLRGVSIAEKPSRGKRTWLSLDKKGWTLSSVYQENADLLVRIFNAEGDDREGSIIFHFNPGKVEMVELNGELREELQVDKRGEEYSVRFAMPQFGLRTLRLSGDAGN